MAETLQFIKGLNPQLREKLIYREYLNQKYKLKKAQGWDEVHKTIKGAPYCRLEQQISNIFFCSNCMHRAEIYRCTLCHRKIKNHYLKYTGFNKNEYDECFIRLHPRDIELCDKFRAIYVYYDLEHYLDDDLDDGFVAQLIR